MSSRLNPSSDASRPQSRSRSGILTPASDKSLNQELGDNGPPSSLGKRKRQVHPMEDLLKPSITVKPHPVNLLLKPRTLQPLMLLPREHLAISYLDLSSPSGDFSWSRYYESHIKILDLEDRLGSRPVVLIARTEANRSVFAIERHENGQYVLCKLGSWVDLAALSRQASVVCHQRVQPPWLSAPGPLADQPLTTPLLHKENKKKRLAIEAIQSMVKRPRAPGSTPVQENPSAVQETTRAQEAQEACDPDFAQGPALAGCSAESEPAVTAPGLPRVELDFQPTAEDIFSGIRSQYFEALYHSMGSLAYFAKGPLSRARAAFHLDCDATLEMNDLIGFLKSLVLTTVLIDKKYRETLPAAIAKMRTLVESSENEAKAGAKAKRRRTRKMKLGKDGLYPAEDEHVRQWWQGHKPESGDEGDPTCPEQMKYHISCLRTRETQLQMILIFEILALETMRPTEDAADSQLPGLTPNKDGKDASSAAPAKKRSKHNFPLLLDVHADRLCIWQSTTPDDIRALAESQMTSHSTQKFGKDAEPLRDFCIDIIMPFFSARLPELCDPIIRKLGGPVIKSPPKARQHKSAAWAKSQPKAVAKPGTATKRHEPGKSSRNLERVLSNDRLRRSVSRGPTGAIALMRSATSTTIPGLKREGSEPLLASLPRKASVSSKDRPTNPLSRSSSQNAIGDPRTKRKEMMEAELKDAITALRKPNRELAGKAIAEDAEKRAVQPKKETKKPARGAAQGVQVKATPANNRYRDVYGADFHDMKRFDLQRATGGGYHVPSSSDMIPSSAPQRGQGAYFESAQIMATPHANRIRGTPSRASMGAGQSGARSVRFTTDEATMPPSSPITARKIPGPDYLAIPKSAPGRREEDVDDLASPGLAGLFETPVKARPVTVVADSAVALKLEKKDAAAEDRAENKELDIYQRLGWDDDDIDDLA